MIGDFMTLPLLNTLLAASPLLSRLRLSHHSPSSVSGTIVHLTDGDLHKISAAYTLGVAAEQVEDVELQFMVQYFQPAVLKSMAQAVEEALLRRVQEHMSWRQAQKDRRFRADSESAWFMYPENESVLMGEKYRGYYRSGPSLSDLEKRVGYSAVFYHLPVYRIDTRRCVVVNYRHTHLMNPTLEFRTVSVPQKDYYHLQLVFTAYVGGWMAEVDLQ